MDQVSDVLLTTAWFVPNLRPVTSAGWHLAPLSRPRSAGIAYKNWPLEMDEPSHLELQLPLHLQPWPGLLLSSLLSI
jgi:hypothetical protein